MKGAETKRLGLAGKTPPQISEFLGTELRIDIGGAHRQQLIAAITQMTAHGVVDVNETARRAVLAGVNAIGGLFDDGAVKIECG